MFAAPELSWVPTDCSCSGVTAMLGIRYSSEWLTSLSAKVPRSPWLSNGRARSASIAAVPPVPTQAQYSLILRVRLSNRPGRPGRVASAIGQAGAQIGTIDLVQLADGYAVRDITVETGGETHGDRVVHAVDGVDGAEVVDTTDRTFLMHVGGKIEQHNKHALRTRDALSMAYTPGVARVCSAIAADRDKAF